MDNKTLQGNRLIAEFMGLKPESDKDDRYFNMPDRIYKYDIDHFKISNTSTPEKMLYHLSWDWLIPVIQTCKERQVFGGQGLISNIEKRLLEFDLLATFGNIISYIEYYNVKATANDRD